MVVFLALLLPYFRTVSLRHLLGILNAQERGLRTGTRILIHATPKLTVEPKIVPVQMGITFFCA